MLTFRNTNIVFIILTGLLSLLILNRSLPIGWLLVPAITYLIIIFYGCYYVGSDFFIKIICAADTDKKEIALSFDDGPSLFFTPQILDILKQQKVEAAFFCIGKRIAENKNLLKHIHQQGHLIGNHSYSHHFFFDLFSSKKMLADIQQAEEIIKETVGMIPTFFRPPYGVTNPNLAKAITTGKYIPIGWNVRSMDTVVSDENKLLSSMNKAIKPGAIFLFHDTSKTTLHVLPDFIKTAHSMGYRFVRLDKMLKLNAYA